ncbi:STAS domain-containing protein [Sphingomonas sp. PsM26]|jgi:anti-anti-sigma regulatory factor|nr:STAS domain-containing protein [Sphingomonas sp. PsM26]
MTRLTLPSTLDLPAVIRLADALRSTTGPVLLNGAAVERIGVAALQLFLSAQATAKAGGQMFKIEQASDAFSSAAHVAGADALLQSNVESFS